MNKGVRCTLDETNFIKFLKFHFFLGTPCKMNLQTYLNKDVLSVSVIIFSLSAILIHLSLWPSLWRRVYFALFVEGDMVGGGPELRNTAKKIYDHHRKNRRNTATAKLIFSYVILTSTLDIILLYLNNFPQNRHTKMYACQCMPTHRYC